MVVSVYSYFPPSITKFTSPALLVLRSIIYSPIESYSKNNSISLWQGVFNRILLSEVELLFLTSIDIFSVFNGRLKVA